jgi:two-component sensor histidine kinase
LGRAQQLVSDTPGESPDLRTFVLSIIEPFGPERCLLDGPTSSAPQHLGQSCALLLHELSTNATKYGALSAPDGKVEIKWRAEGDGVRLEWREMKGPPVVTPTRSGFGSRLLRTAFPPEYGKASLVFDPAGVQCTVHLALV